MIIDSHCHLQMLDQEKLGDLSTILKAAKQADVEHILCVGVDLTHAHQAVEIAEQYPHVSASIGLHPSEKLANEPDEAAYLELAKHPKVIAIGETGLDYHYNDSGLENMRERFRRQIRVAKQVKKPLIIHSRDAREDTIKILQEESASEVKGVMHCFTESWEMAEQAMALGFYVSFSGIVTFKNAKNVQEVAKKVPLERMLIETDAPYLTPDPYRGKPNGPQYVRLVAEKIAELKNCDYAEVAKHTTQNFYNLFNLQTTE
ncbi:MAG: TatD family hydrolase [Gammaproteobacteria bacterium]|nr:TatD family hydrolase [Gammaproteobacteria bacterium]